MTSECEIVRAPTAAPILWITGLSGTGKTTLALALAQALRAQGQRPLVLDGDSVRHLVEPDEAHDSHAPPLRLHRAWRMARMARWAAMQGIPVIVATMSLRHDVQDWSRAGPTPYAEVLLQANMELLRQRNPTLYGAPGQASPPNVVGLDIPAEFPRQPELRLPQNFAMDDLPRHLAQVLALWESLWPGRAMR